MIGLEMEYNLGFPGIGETQLKGLTDYHYKKNPMIFIIMFACMFQ